MAGTNLLAPQTDNVDVSLTDGSGNALMIRCTVANLPSGAGYGVACLAQTTDGGVYQNTGTASSTTWTLVDTAATSLQLPEAATDSSTTTGTSLALTMNTVTTGNGLTMALNGLTTGKGLSLTHTTAVIANGGSLLSLSSTSIDTSTTTGVLQNLSSTASLAGTQVLWTFSGLTTGIGFSMVNAAQTTGDAISITTAAATTGGGIVLTTPSSNALAIGLAGKTNPAFQVDSSTASQAAGLKITGAIAAGTVAVAVISSGADANLSINAKGTGTIGIGSVSTGAVTITPATTITGLLTLTGGFTSAANAILKSGTAVPATAGAVAAGAPITLYSSSITIEITSDAPTHTRPKGSICINTGGNSGSTRMYVNTDGAGTWTSFTTAT